MYAWIIQISRTILIIDLAYFPISWIQISEEILKTTNHKFRLSSECRNQLLSIRINKNHTKSQLSRINRINIEFDAAHMQIYPTHMQIFLHTYGKLCETRLKISDFLSDSPSLSVCLMKCENAWTI